MNKGEQFKLDGAEYRCLIDGIALDGEKIAWPKQKPIKAATAIRRKAVEKVAGTDVPELFSNMGVSYAGSDKPTNHLAVRESEESASSKGRWFLQINEINFAGYFSRGIIAPVAWQKGVEAREHDLQSVNPGALVLLPNVSMSSRYGTVAIEIALSDTERKAAGKGAFHCLPGSLPGSRIVKAHFPASAGAPDAIRGRFVYPDVHVPKGLIAADFERLPAVQESGLQSLIDEIKRCPLADAGRKAISGLDAYDRMLGSLAMMRTAGYFFTRKERMFWEYPNALPVALDALGVETGAGKPASCPKDVAAAIRHLLLGCGTGQPLPTALREAVFAGETLDFTAARDMARRYVKQMSSKAATEAFSLLFNDDDYKTCVGILGQSREMLPCLALAYLYKFHKKDSNDPANAFSWAGQDLVDDSSAAYVLGLLGAYYGYARLPAFADIDDMDASIGKAVGGSRLPVKFGPRNRIELLIMEHVHAQAFSAHEPYDRSLPALDDRRPGSLPGDVEDVSADLCGCRAAIFRKLDPVNSLASMIQSTYPPFICQHEYVLATCIAQYWPDLGCYPRLGPYDRDAVCARLKDLTGKQLTRMKRHVEFDREENRHG